MTDFEHLLRETSRTFGISIPLLEEPHRRRLTLAYLLFRVADTLEDSEEVPLPERLAALAELQASLAAIPLGYGEQKELDWINWRLPNQPSYQELLGEFTNLRQAIVDLEPGIRATILGHADRTIAGMRAFLSRAEADGTLRLTSLKDLREYCYVVAGIVGEMITDLLVEPILPARQSHLRNLAATFGEGLQLVNILRDAADDAHAGRIFLPPKIDCETIIQLARTDLVAARQYVVLLQALPVDPGVVPFAEFPLRLAERTLHRVELEGAGAKVTRAEVAELLLDVDDRLQSRDQLPLGLQRPQRSSHE